MPRFTKTASAGVIEAEQLATQLAEAEADLSLRKQAADEAHDAFDQIDAAYEAGDDTTYTVEEYTRAEAAALLAGKLHDAAAKRVKALDRQQVNTDLSAAALLAPVISGVFRDRVPVEFRIGDRPKNGTVATVPSVVLTQAKPSKVDGGLVVGPAEVEVTYARDDLMAPFPTSRFISATEAAHMQVEVRDHGNRRSGVAASDAEVYDRIVARIHEAAPSPMVIAAEPDQGHFKRWGTAVARQFAGAVEHNTKTMRMDSDPLRFATATDIEATGKASIDGSTVTTTLRLTATITPGFSPLPGFTDRWRAMPATYVGKPAAHLGICESLTLVEYLNASRQVGWAETDRFSVVIEAVYVAEIEG